MAFSHEFERAFALLENPSPLAKGRGVKAEGLINNLLQE